MMRSCPFRLGITLLEVLVCLTLFAVMASIVFASIRAVKRGMADAECVRRMLLIKDATLLYRVQNEGLSVSFGTAEQLGLPLSVFDIPIVGKSWGERYDFCVCPLLPDDPWFTYPYYWYPHRSDPWKDGRDLYSGRVSFAEMTSIMGDAAPLAADYEHNSPSDDLSSPRVPHRVIWTDLGGTVHNRILIGFSGSTQDLLRNSVHMEDWVRWYDHDTWQKILERYFR